MKERLFKLLDNAYAPYSNYHVASLVEMKDGQIFEGVNVENASFGATICAERNAINNAIANGYHKNDFKAIYIMNGSDKIGVPCFLCIETISEFFEMEADIILYTKDGLEQDLKVKDFIKYDFSSEDLK